MIETFFDNHSHTCYSNLRLPDCINQPKDLINKAKEMGLAGIAITDHEALCCHIQVNKMMEEMKDSDFTIALGNEIYLTETREPKQPYYHFILIAKDAIGHRLLREQSSTAWYNMYKTGKMHRVPTLKSELAAIVQKAPGHLIATSACIGGELGKNILDLIDCETVKDYNNARRYETQIDNFIKYCLNLFGEDFYFEVAPAASDDQIKVNRKILELSNTYGIKMCIGSDAHYLTEETRFAHKAYLNSKDGDREVDSFYEYAHLMTPEEARSNLQKSFSDEIIDWIFDNSLEIKNKIQHYSLLKKQSIPEVEVKDYPKGNPFKGVNNDFADEFNGGTWNTLESLFCSDNIQERYWVNQCFDALIKKDIGFKTEYIDRLEEEAKIKRIIGEKLGTCMFAYPNTLQHYIDLFWNCGSTVGAGRGSACSGLNHYLLGITQLDPIKWNLPFWRYLNEERVELGDIDIDLAPSKLQKIFREIRKERGELGLIQVCNFGTEKTKNAILVACRGYRNEEYPDGIDSDEALYLSSMIPQERGFVWSLNDMLYGDPEKGRVPQKQFINAVNQYPGLIDVIKNIGGLISRRGIHASGVIFFDENNIYDTAAIMRAPNGALTTQWDLHDQEAAGSVKYDFLLTKVQDIIIQTINFLQRDGLIEKDYSLREVYNKYLHPEVLPQDDEKMWDALAKNKVLSCFQFDSAVGALAAKKIKPTTALEMADANGLMRLMTAEKGAESPLDKYVRFKNNIGLWYEEMNRAGLTKTEQKTLEPYFLPSYGVPPSQEQMMRILMDKDICHFTLGEANGARKIVGKKQMEKIPDLREKVLGQAASPALGKYVWECGIGPQMGYSFSIIHALAYSFIGMQTLYLATNFNPIYWNTSCLIVNSNSIDDDEDYEDMDEEEIKKAKSANYDKIAKAIGDIQAAGIKVSLIDINKSGYGFEPDVENNEILFGLKGLLNVGDEIVDTIIANRPYNSPKEFLLKVRPNKQAMISLIKSGAFDKMEDRKFVLSWYIYETCDKKKRITLQNLNGLRQNELLPQNDKFEIPYKIYEFTRYLKLKCKASIKTEYNLDQRAIDFLNAQGYDNLIEQLVVVTNNQGFETKFILDAKKWDNIYQKWMDIYRKWMGDNQQDILQALNSKIFKEDWDKYAKCQSTNPLSAWEMEVMCFYYHEHELKNLNEKYGYSDFYKLPEEPEIERTIYKKGMPINLYKLHRIYGTCIAKNKTKSTVSLLTPSGVVTVKFRKEYFNLFDKRISAVGADGKKHVVENSWFNRGSMIVVTGIRRDTDFIAKKYSTTGGHQLYKIDSIDANGNIELRNARYQGDVDEED